MIFLPSFKNLRRGILQESSCKLCSIPVSRFDSRLLVNNSSHVNFEINAWKINNKIELIHNTGLGKIYCEISNGCTLRILFRHFLSHSNFRSRRARISIRCDVLPMKMLNVKKKTKTNQFLNNKNNNDHCFVDEQRKMINEPFFHFFRGTYSALGLKQSGVTC